MVVAALENEPKEMALVPMDGNVQVGVLEVKTEQEITGTNNCTEKHKRPHTLSWQIFKIQRVECLHVLNEAEIQVVFLQDQNIRRVKPCSSGN